MKRLLVTVALSLAPALALAGGHDGGQGVHGSGDAGGAGHADVHLALPANHTRAVVQPGVEVVVGLDDEVFYTNDHYWLRRGGGWYHATHHGDAFVYTDSGDVPSVLVGIPVGQYRHYRHGGAHTGDGHDGHGQHGAGGHGGSHGNGC